ncbi:RpiB/LacA/LacB family sugar-phosphate isomerase [Streptosporangium canum]|uniref:RpiB/LacA/LacB family sugar-phosphate isomerase n=1 Tax=Streptosporangium canum TaxID=324952 RepID=UPI0036CA51ED
MRISLASDSLDGIAPILMPEIRKRGHTVIGHGAMTDERADWAWCCSRTAEDVASGVADQAVVCRWTGTGASIAANKAPGGWAARCVDAATAAGARRWNDADVPPVSLRPASAPLPEEILDAWFSGSASSDETDLANIAYLSEIEN